MSMGFARGGAGGDLGERVEAAVAPTPETLIRVQTKPASGAHTAKAL